MRLHLLNANQSQAVVIGIFYTSPMRLDIYIDGMYIEPTNAYYEDGKQLRHPPQPNRSWLPDVASDPSGTNYFDREQSILYVLVRNSFPVLDIRTSPVVFLCFQFADMTLEEFYGINLVNNLALFLGIPPEKIKIARATRESGNRRKRQLETLNVDVEISNDPRNLTDSEMNPVSARDYAAQTNESVSQINGTQDQVTVTPGQGSSSSSEDSTTRSEEPQSEVDCSAANSQDKANPNSECFVPYETVVLENELSYEQLQRTSAAVVATVQTGDINEVVNSTVLNVAVVDPVPNAADLNSTEVWAEISEQLQNASVGGIAALATSIQIPAILEIIVLPTLKYEGSTFGSQSSLHFLDSAVGIQFTFNLIS